MDLGFYFVDINLILTGIGNFFMQSTLVIIWEIFLIIGWSIVAWLLLYVAVNFFAGYREDKNTAKWNYVVLAVDIPQLNIQTPMAVEQMFSHLAGAFDKPDLKAKFIDGYKQRYFSVEIISIEGYIQFLIWTEEAFVNLVEAAVYAQYPEAEITQVEDYTNSAPERFPDKNYDVWISDFGLAEDSAYPIRSYREFEHNISKDTVLKDPMGTFLESFARIGKGEQMWFQIMVEPVDSTWKEDAIKKIKEVIGETKSGGDSILDKVIRSPMKLLEGLGDQVFNREAGEGGEEKKREDVNKLQYMTPGQMKVVESMEMKISKIGFKTKMRGVYLARKEVFNTTRGVNALVGAINQFNIPTANSLVPTVSAKKDNKKSEFLNAYKKRKMKVGSNPFFMNIEELATVWHFPMSHVKTPLVQKAVSKVSEPPSGLPIEELFTTPKDLDVEIDGVVSESEDKKKDTGQKKFFTDSGEEIGYEDLF